MRVTNELTTRAFGRVASSKNLRQFPPHQSYTSGNPTIPPLRICGEAWGQRRVLLLLETWRLCVNGLRQDCREVGTGTIFGTGWGSQTIFTGCSINLHNGLKLFCSDIKPAKCAQAGVGVLVRPQLATCVDSWTALGKSATCIKHRERSNKFTPQLHWQYALNSLTKLVKPCEG